MAHPCPDCGALCYCDGEDVEWDEPPADCDHQCDPCPEEEDRDAHGAATFPQAPWA